MPSAANIKVDKQLTSETASVDSASNQQNTPIRQAVIIIEHKIRNLEKRKAKLESYRELQNSGKDLNQDQRIAIAKFDEVVQTLEFARDLCKQFQAIALTAEREAKKNARKEATVRSQQELAKVREVLLVQDALHQLGHDAVREDFLLGRNGAVAISESDLKLLDDLYPEVSPKHEPGSPANFATQVQTAAEHLLAVVDGKPKEAFGSTYSYIKEVIGKIHESGYLDQPLLENNETEYVEEVSETVNETENLDEQIADIPVENPMGTYHIDLIPQEEAAAPVVAPPVLEQPYFQQPRPLTEVLGSGTFYFLQESELDSPDQSPQNPVLTTATIPSQTFTNQNFVSVPEAVVPRQNTVAAGFVTAPNPPPPIPMPPSHLTALEYTGVPPMPATINYAGFQQSVPEETQPAPLQPQVQSHMQAQQPTQQSAQHTRVLEPNVRNGGEDEEITSGVAGGSPRNEPRPPRNSQRRTGSANHSQSNYHQSYYQQPHQQQQPLHNNGFSNNTRQRVGRGGSRPAGSRSQHPQKAK